MSSSFIEPRLLRAFVTVAEELHFTRAAARLYVAQQALSRDVRRLERELGAELFVRTTRQVTLTGDGRRLLPYARGCSRRRTSCSPPADRPAPCSST
ncbi:HTH-type transcriptional regulator PgrR [Streptomyces glaucescens]